MKKKIILFIIFLLIIFFSIKFFHIKEFFTEQNLKNIIERSGLWAPIIFILIYSITPVLFLPGIPLALLAGFLFGPFWGVIYSNIGATIGASFAFFIARYFLREWVEEKIKGTKLESLDRTTEKNGWKLVAFTRLIPLFPYNMLNYFFGITNVKFFHYLLATFFCMIPGCVGYVVFGSSLLDFIKGKITLKFYIGIILIIFISLIPCVYRKISNK